MVPITQRLPNGDPQECYFVVEKPGLSVSHFLVNEEGGAHEDDGDVDRD